MLDVDDVQAVASNWQLSIPGPCNRLTKRYYRLGRQLIAVRTNGELNYLHGDHLGSVSLLTDATGQKVRGGEQRFHPFGTVRTGQPAFYPTERGYTGQRLDLSTDLMYYEARYYDPLLARFVQADTIVPGAGSTSTPLSAGSQGLNRYSYVLNICTTAQLLEVLERGKISRRSSCISSVHCKLKIHVRHFGSEMPCRMLILEYSKYG